MLILAKREEKNLKEMGKVSIRDNVLFQTETMHEARTHREMYARLIER